MLRKTLSMEEKTYTKAQVRNMIYAAYKAGQGGHGNDLSHQNHRLYALRRMFPKVFTERQPGHVTRHQREKAKKAAFIEK